MSPVLVEVVLSSAEVQRCVVCWSLKFWVDVGCNRLLISFNFAASRLVCVNKSNYNTIQFPCV